jgi:hypothetical protein
MDPSPPPSAVHAFARCSTHLGGVGQHAAKKIGGAAHAWYKELMPGVELLGIEQSWILQYHFPQALVRALAPNGLLEHSHVTVPYVEAGRAALLLGLGC